jgi:hemoglobin/transferrin/lactoferrin receptor protein
MEGFTGHFAAGWTEGEDRETGQPINSIDPPRGRLGVAYAAPSGAWDGSLEVTLVAAKHDVDESAGPLFRPGAYSVLDLRLRWRPGPRLTVAFGLFNLTDRRYYEWASVRGVAPDDPMLPLYREPGRNVAVTVTATTG